MTKEQRIEQLTLQLDEQKRRYANDIEMAQQLAALALRALSVRMLTTLVLVADVVLFAGALYLGTWQSILTAVLFAAATWAVLHLRPPNVKEKGNEEGVVS